MKRIHFIVEGDTEVVFVKEIVKPYLLQKGIYDISVSKVPTSKKSKGGMLNYYHIKNDITRFLKQREDIIITSFIDYFKLPGTFPKYHDTMNLSDSRGRIDALEAAFKEDINDDRFIPYIQLYEFEALLFSSIDGFISYWYEIPKIISQINKIITDFPNPEDINDNPRTAPSKRLIKIIPEYDKILYGNLIAIEIGIDKILEKCPRFNKWINTIIDKVSEKPL